MASVKKRSNGRWTALYRPTPTGSTVSAGTYETEERALEVAQLAEAHARRGGTGVAPQVKASMTIEDYAKPWLRNHRVEPSTKTHYASVIRHHIIPRFGHVRVSEIQREQIREYITVLQSQGSSPATQRGFRAVMSAMLGTAWDDGYRNDNPVRGLKTERNSSKPLTVMRVEEFGRVYRALPSDGARLLGNLVVSTGCRLGEAAPLLVKDVDLDRRTVTFEKALQLVDREFSPNGQRFYVAPYTKTHDRRVVKIDKRLTVQLLDWIVTHDLKPSDQLFPRALILPRKPRTRKILVELTDELVASLGTFLGPNGVEYRHGTTNGYTTGKCRCDPCTQASADYQYERLQAKASRQAEASDCPYVTRENWRGVWVKACQDAGLTFQPTAYQLRHTHASWLINNGEDPKTVMGRLGHKDLSTTSKYVHMVDPDDESAADIMDSLGDW